MNRWFIGSILILLIFLCLPYSQGQQNPQTPGELYDSGMESFYKGHYEEAIDRFSKLILFFSTSRLHSYSRYMIGQCYLKMKKYPEALQQFELYLKNFPDGDRVRGAEKGIQTSKEKLQEKSSPPSLQPTVPDEPDRKTDEVKLPAYRAGLAGHVPVNPLTPQPGSRRLAFGPWTSAGPAEISGRGLKIGPGPGPYAISERPGFRVAEEVNLFSQDKKARRRICVQVFDLDILSLEEAEKDLKALKLAGVDTVIFRVFQNRGGRVFKFVTPRFEEGVYFETRYAPVVDDILGKVVEMVHRNGLDLFAWITTRYANYGLDEQTEYRCMGYNFETKRTEVARGFNLFHPDVLKRLEGLFRDLGRYPIDGILFQDDLILKHNEDFSPEANRAFLKEFGYSPCPDLFYIDPYRSDSGKYYVKAYTGHFWTWANWKNRWLMNVAKRLMEAARESNPKLKFGINLYYETALNSSNAVAWFSQTFSGALEKNFDYYALMAYHRQPMKDQNMEERRAMELMAEVAEKAVKQVGDPYQVLMKVQLFDWKSSEALPAKEVEDVVTGILNHGEVSLAFVPYMDQFPLEALKGKWIPPK